MEKEKIKKFRKVPINVAVSELSPLNISCTTTKCEANLHCFKTNEKLFKKFGKHGVCRECGIDLIDWERIQENDLKNAKFMFESMKNELIRHVYWHIRIKEDDVESAFKKGRTKIQNETRTRIANIIGVAEPYRGGITPYFGNIIYYAQHATATCCRECMHYWHGFEIGRKLTDEQIDYSTDLIMLYIKEKLPKLQSEEKLT